MNYEIKVEGLKELIDKLGKATAQETIEEPFYQGVLNMQAWIQKNRLSGPRPTYLGVVTNRLRSSIMVSRSIKKDSLEFRIGTNVKYAPIHEFGFAGYQHVSSHIRKSFEKVRLFGKSKKVRTGDIFVRAFDRGLIMPARPFLRPGIQNQDNVNFIVTKLNKAITGALNAGK